MDKCELYRLLEFEYYGILEANPTWQQTKKEFMLERGFELEDLGELDPWMEDTDEA